MPKFRYTRVVTNYTFTPPQNISEADYNTLKNLLKINPNADISGGTKEEDKDDGKMYMLLVIGLVCFFIGLLTILNTDKVNDVPGWAGFLWIGGLFFIIHPIVNGGMLQTSVNKSSADKYRQAFFSDLKSMIISSSNYKSFSKDYGKKYNPFYIDQEKYFKDAFPGLKYKPND